MTVIQEDTDIERLSRVEANQEALVRETADVKQETRHLRTEIRYYFFGLLVVMIAMWVSIIIALIT